MNQTPIKIEQNDNYYITVTGGTTHLREVVAKDIANRVASGSYTRSKKSISIFNQAAMLKDKTQK